MANTKATLSKAQETQRVGFDLGKVHDSFVEMHNLLEQFGPLWYTEEVHNRAQNALTQIRESLALSRLKHLRNEKSVFRTNHSRRHRVAA